MVSMFAKVDALPGSQRKFAGGDRDARRCSQKGGLHVGGHIIGAFDRMYQRQALFGGEMIKNCFHIRANIRVRVFVDRKTGRGMLDKQVQQTNLQLTNLWNPLHHVTRDQVKPSRFRG